MLDAKTWEEARDIRKRIEGKGVTKQAWGIMDKIIEVDQLMQRSPDARKRIHEVHPEVCFRELAGHPMADRKKSRKGRTDRLHHLNKHFVLTESDVLAHARNLHCHPDDIIDSAVALWTGERIASGAARRLPEEGGQDAEGRSMQIWA